MNVELRIYNSLFKSINLDILNVANNELFLGNDLIEISVRLKHLQME